MHRRGVRKGWTRRELGRIAGAAVLAPAVLRGRASAGADLPKLPALPEADALLLMPSDRRYAAYQPASNKRAMLQPALRAVCRTPRGVATMIAWARTHGLAFALRSGGHSYEGFSESPGVVIDTREIADVSLDAATDRITVGAGASLGVIYRFLAQRGLALPAGSCPTVGISGHTLGGGYGLLARPRGLSCDSLVSIDLIGPEARAMTVATDAGEDLFWACRGGGGGTFGAATHFTFQAFRRPSLSVFGLAWLLPLERAVRLFKAWQAWSPHAPADITAILTVTSQPGRLIALRCFGQSAGTTAQLRAELSALLQVAAPARTPIIADVPFLAAVDRFSGGWHYQSHFSKGKSDFILSRLGDDGIATLMTGLQSFAAGGIVAICDPYGGAIAQVPIDGTAFAHRAGTLYCIQYYSSWDTANASDERLAGMRSLYAAMRPFVSGAAYVNYCDLDLADWPVAYWGANLPRLSRIKAAFDPDNVFRHAQSVPLSVPSDASPRPKQPVESLPPELRT